MGNKQSKTKRPPHEVLGLPPTSTRQEIRDQYKRLILKVHPDFQRVHASNAPAEASEIIGAYTELMRSPPAFEFYTEGLFRSDLRKYADDFFERVGSYCKISAPTFSSPDFERFYQIFTNFRTHKEFDSREDRDAFCLNVRRVAKMVRGLDRRMSVAPVIEKKVVPRTREKKVKTYPFNCEHCRKGFNSPNQILNHFRSRKHFENVRDKAESPEAYVKNQISELSHHDETDRPAPDTVSDDTQPVDEVPVPGPTCNAKREFKQEPTPFRTCAICKLVFKTRTELFSHLRTTHAG